MILIIICFIDRLHAQNCSASETSGCDLGNGWQFFMPTTLCFIAWRSLSLSESRKLSRYKMRSFEKDQNQYFCCDSTSLCNNTIPIVPCLSLPDQFNSFSKQDLICCSSNETSTDENILDTTQTTSLANVTTTVSTTTTTTEWFTTEHTLCTFEMHHFEYVI